MERFVRAGDLESGVFIPDRATAAIHLHQKIQQSRPHNYESEVVISHTHDTSSWTIHVSGRIDGIYTQGEKVVLEEIKTTTRSPAEVAKEDNPHHWAQLKIYAYMTAVTYHLQSVDTCLTYAQLHTHAMKEIRQSFEFTELEDFFSSLMSRLVQRIEGLHQFRTLRNRSIDSLEFPFDNCRSGQQQMMEESYQAIVQGEQLLVQAPTGIGKTMAVLMPALKSLTQSEIDRIFYLTARSTGKQVAEEAFDILTHQGLRLKRLTLTAKEKICFSPDSECNPLDCEYARGYYDRIDEAMTKALEIDCLHRDAIEEMAKECKVCPFELALELTEMADCIICDYNYVFDPQAYLRRFFTRPKEAYLFLVDEAHNLVDRSRDMFSADIRKRSFLSLRRQVKESLPDVYRSLGEVNKRILEIIKTNQDRGETFADKDIPEELILALQRFIKACEKWLALNRRTSFRDALLELYFEVNRFLKVSELFDASYAVCYQKIAKDFRISLFCIDPSGPLSQVLEKGRATIFFSATLTPTDYYQRSFGCGLASSGLVLASPFAKENLCVMVSGVSTYFRNRSKTKSQIANLIQSLVTQKTGNYLVFFPSYAYMSMTVQAFESLYPEMDILVQTPRLSEAERVRFLQKFHHSNTSTLVGFAVMGGVFGEGIDLVGDRLTGAVVVGVGMPPPSLNRELIKAYFSDRYDAGFEFAYVYPGFNKVLQAAGRVIRSETDQGVVLLVDSRFRSDRYQRMFPNEWQPSDVTHPSDVIQELGLFWE